MRLEDLQEKWGNQFAESSRGEDSKIAIDLMERIRRGERRFRRVVILLALRDLVALSLWIWILVIMLTHSGQHRFPQIDREQRAIFVIGFGLVIAMNIAVTRSSLHGTRVTPSTAEGGAVLPERFRSAARRFDMMILWRDLRELARGIFLVSLAVMVAWRAEHWSAYAWMAVGLFTTSIVSFQIYGLRTRAQRPPVDDTLLGTLTLSIYQVRRQVQLFDNLWWYIAPICLGFLLLGSAWTSLVGGGVRPRAIVGGLAIVTVYWICWRLNRWAAWHPLRRRLEQLEKLKSELSIDASSNQP